MDHIQGKNGDKGGGGGCDRGEGGVIEGRGRKQLERELSSQGSVS